jgi:N-acetylglucosamine repressor
MAETRKLKNHKRESLRLILNLLDSPGDLSVLELSEMTQLSKPTVMKVLNRYAQRGFVINVGKGTSTDGGGKRPSLFRFNEEAGSILVYHVFPDELYAVLTDLKSTILHAESLPLSDGDGASEFLDKARFLFEKHRERGFVPPDGPVGIAVGTHGITDYVRGIVIHSPHFPLLGDNFPLREALQESLAFKGPIIVDNQIRFQAYAEKTRGAAQGKRNIIVIEGGIGLVAGIIVKDEIKRGAHFLAGEIGHMILNPFEREPCSCGGRGCFEVMVSARRLIRRAEEARCRFPGSIFAGRPSFGPSDLNELFSASNSGDPLAEEVMDEAARWFAIGISNLILAYDPEMIIIQGLFVRAAGFFLHRLKKHLGETSLVRVKRSVEILYSQLGRDAGIIGASAFMAREYVRNLILCAASA